MKKLIHAFIVVLLLIPYGCSGGGNDLEGSADTEDVKWKTLATPIIAGGHSIANPMIAFLPDGRMVATEGLDNKNIRVALEDSKGSMTFRYVMTIIPEGDFSYPCFIKTLDANRVIIGASDVIYTADVITAKDEILAFVGNYDGAVHDNVLYVTRYGYVSKIDLGTKIVSDVVTGIPGYSGGICIDSSGNIYTGIGSSLDETGHIRMFPSSIFTTWSEGNFIADVLSADSLIYNNNGKILVGGGDVFGTSGDYDYFCAIDALTGEILFKLDPDPLDKSSYKLARGGGMFAASVWDWANGKGTVYTLPFEALGL